MTKDQVSRCYEKLKQPEYQFRCSLVRVKGKREGSRKVVTPGTETHSGIG